MIKKRTKIIILIIIVLVISIILITAFDNNVKISRYKITSDKVSDSIKIVHISDLHNQLFGDDQKPLIDRIVKEEPDIIMLTGDIVGGEPIQPTEMLLEGICELAPIYYVTGNHEYPLIQSRNKYGEYEDIITTMKRYNVTNLNDEFTEITIKGNNLIIAGINDPAGLIYGNAKSEDELKNIFQTIKDSNKYTVLMAHRPEMFKNYIEYGFDLVLSGHSHGGQVRIPFILNGLFAPNQGFFPARAGGLYQDGKMNHIVSRGLALQSFEYDGITVPRIFNPPELCLIEVG